MQACKAAGTLGRGYCGSGPRGRRRRRRRGGRASGTVGQRAGRGHLGDRRAPPLDVRGRLAVHLEPGQRVAERAARHQRPRRARRDVRVAQPPLQREDLVQPLDVAPRDGQRCRASSAPPRAPGARGRARSRAGRAGCPRGSRWSASRATASKRARNASTSASDCHSASCDAGRCSSGVIGSSSPSRASVRKTRSDAPVRRTL